MNIHVPKFVPAKQQTLLVCVMERLHEHDRINHHGARNMANAARLIKWWEERESPFAYIRAPDMGSESGWASRSRQVRPQRPGDLVFELAQLSLLRDQKFRSFFGDMGAPPIVMMGADLDGLITATVVDAFLSHRAIAVVSDAVSMTRTLASSQSPSRSAILRLISNFASIVKTEDLENEWR